MRNRGRLLIGVGLGLLLSWAGLTVSLQAQGGREFAAIAESQAEFDAVEAIVADASPLNKLSLSQAFLTEYPDSEMAHQVYSIRVQTYIGLENHRLVIETAEAGLAAEMAFYESKVAPLADPEGVPGFGAFRHDSMNTRTFYYQSMMNAHRELGNFQETADYGELALSNLETDWTQYGETLDQGGPEYQEALESFRRSQLFFLQRIMTAYQNLDDAARTVEYAERALEVDPQNLATLITVSTVMAERAPEDEDEREDHFERAKEYAEDAMEILEQFLEGPAGTQLGEAQKANLVSGAHSTLGLVYLNQEEFGDAQDEYRMALEAVPEDPVAHLRLGMAYARDEKAEEALEALARSVYLKGPTEEAARELLQQIYEVRNQSLDGLDEFIQSEGEKIGTDE